MDKIRLVVKKVGKINSPGFEGKFNWQTFIYLKDPKTHGEFAKIPPAPFKSVALYWANRLKNAIDSNNGVELTVED